MQNHSHDQHIGGGQRIVKEVSRAKADALLKSERSDVIVKERTHRGQVETLALKMGVGERNLHRKATLGSPDISEPNISATFLGPLQIAASVFTPDPLGSGNAPIYISINGGETWTLNIKLPGGNKT